jgi:hypothetical protein
MSESDRRARFRALHHAEQLFVIPRRHHLAPDRLPRRRR